MLYKFLHFLDKIILYPLFRVEVKGKENLPDEGAYIICANHWSNWDPFFIAGILSKPISFMAKREFFDYKFLSWLLNTLYAFPVDREKFDLKSLRHSVDLINNDKVIGIFPEGTRVKEVDRKNIKDGAGYVALKTKADIVPVEIISTYRPFSKTRLLIKKPLEVDDYKDYKRKIAMEKIMDDTFSAIYENRDELESRK